MTLGDVTNLIVAVTSIVAIFFAVFTFRRQMGQSRMFLGIQILRAWFERFFYSDDMRRRRLVTCQYLQGRSTEQIDYEEIPAEAWEVLDAFDEIGIYVNRGVIDEELAWASFYYWLNGYWHVLAPHRDRLHQEHGGTLYLKDVEEMYRRLSRYGERHRQLSPVEVRCSSQRIARFVEEELRATGDRATGG